MEPIINLQGDTAQKSMDFWIEDKTFPVLGGIYVK